ncbi:adenosylcobinamide-GDP ribazoletransferase [Pseudoalteromonas luteoviolacea]|uniref:Adenosylcobinamide-GDP ribazoletransferase n=1 Tax=Pseudoalteromonas luteoviolacea TaxID=43657 RepID=A0A1C0TP05_9GAMM|nr:adenosylcobinamide-GDP ribazoletransferase [Pseudoalteromonas luteoviolacea]MBQ4813595.1 adenosylcobinamide-GDP ribazoletransferase [Pseudoalteromonas luteoviolacea]OCQ20545.1 adenosylcobinamide-GDP ribazoletransferase [Pseudoalteromonas luteoviolacea]
MSQLMLLKLAVIFLTRIPIKLNGDVNEDDINLSSRYFAAVGFCIGLCLASALWLLSLCLPMGVAILFTIGLGLIITGAFHEDGFADVWDGFGGGWSQQQKLDIMKDSRIGTYGGTALIILMLSKYQLLLALSVDMSVLLFSIVLAHALSRMAATSIIGKLPYVQLDAQSKVKPVAKSLTPTSRVVLYATGFAVASMGFYLADFSIWHLIGLGVCLWLTRWVCQQWFSHQLGGYTGDCLGAAQQICEIAILTFCVVSLL